MADQLLFTRGFAEDEGIKPRSAARRPLARTGVSSRAFVWLVTAVLLGVTLVMVFEYAVAPKVVIRNYRVESDLDVPASTVLHVAGLEGAHFYFKVDPRAIRRKLEAWAPVKHASVVKVFPDTLRITLTARRPVAMAMATVGGREVPVAFDDDGVVFASGPKVAALDLPVFSGIQFQNFNLGVKLPAMLLGFIREVQELKLSSPALYDLVSEYKIVPRGDHEFDVLLYPVHNHVAIEIGPHIDRALCMYILRTLQIVEREAGAATVKKIDFRTNDVVYTMNKEG